MKQTVITATLIVVSLILACSIPHIKVVQGSDGKPILEILTAILVAYTILKITRIPAVQTTKPIKGMAT